MYNYFLQCGGCIKFAPNHKEYVALKVCLTPMIKTSSVTDARFNLAVHLVEEVVIAF